MTDRPVRKFNTRCYFPGLLLGLVLVGLVFWGRQWLPDQPEKPKADNAPLEVVIKPNTPYKQGQTLRLMNFSAARLEHLQFPQEFVVVKGLDSSTVESVFREDFDPGSYKPMAEGLLSMKDPLHPVSIDLQKVETLERSTKPLKNRQQLQTRRMRVKFKLSSESDTRSYEGSISRVLSSQGQSTEPVVYVSFARDEDYRQMAVPAFLQSVTVR